MQRFVLSGLDLNAERNLTMLYPKTLTRSTCVLLAFLTPVLAGCPFADNGLLANSARLALYLKPVNPGPNDDVTVRVEHRGPYPGPGSGAFPDLLDYWVTGTDGYYDSGRIHFNADGVASFRIPAAKVSGVTDHIKVEWLSRGDIVEADYTF